MTVKYNELKNAHNNIIVHLYRAPAEMTVDKLLLSETWADIHFSLDKGHIIQVIWQDMSKECELRVVGKHNNVVQIKLRGEVIIYDKTSAEEEELNPKYKIKWCGRAKFCVFLENVPEPVLKGFDNKEAALIAALQLPE